MRLPICGDKRKCRESTSYFDNEPGNADRFYGYNVLIYIYKDDTPTCGREIFSLSCIILLVLSFELTSDLTIEYEASSENILRKIDELEKRMLATEKAANSVVETASAAKAQALRLQSQTQTLKAESLKWRAR